MDSDGAGADPGYMYVERGAEIQKGGGGRVSDIT